MLKGHLQIELRNEKTGQVERHEQDNMVTNAVAKVLGLEANGRALMGKSESYSLLPIAQNALGGILLFDGKLEENVDNIHFPMDVHLTGNAGRTKTTSGKYTGSLNELESGETDTGYVSVWDFATSQANGTIAALALTHANCGKAPMDCAYVCNTSLSYSSEKAPIAYDSKNGNLYLYYQGKIYCKKIYTDIIRTKTPSGDATEVFDFKFASPSYDKWSIANGHDGYLYAIYAPNTPSPASVTIRIRKVKISDFSFQEDEEQMVMMDDVSLYQSGRTYVYSWDLVYEGVYTISKGYLYIVGRGNKTIYKINLSNVADKKEFVFEDCSVRGISPMYNGGLFAIFRREAGKTYYGAGLIYKDGECRISEYSSTTSAKWISSQMGMEGDNLFAGVGRKSVNNSNFALE